MNTRLFFISSIIIFSGCCLYSAEKKIKTKGYIPFEKRNNHIYIEVSQPVNKTPIGIRYFTREQGCIPEYYFNYETVTPLANIRSNPYSCAVKRKSDGTSLFTFTCQKSNTIISAKANDIFIVHPEDNKQIRITKNGSDTVVAQFTVT